MSISSEEMKRVKQLGFLNNRSNELFSAKVLTSNTYLSADELEQIAKASRQFGNGKVALTSQMTVEILGIAYEKLEEFQQFLAQAGLMIDLSGDKVRPVISCRGSSCRFGNLDTKRMAEEIQKRFYLGYRSVEFPHKVKVGVGGCPNNCIKPTLHDIGLVGSQRPRFSSEKCHGCKKCACAEVCPASAFRELDDGRREIDWAKCIYCGKCQKECLFEAMDRADMGIRVFLGGSYGKNIQMGTPMPGMYTEEEALDLAEKAMLLFKEEGQPKERFSKMLQRLGIDRVVHQLLEEDILARKDEILAK